MELEERISKGGMLGEVDGAYNEPTVVSISGEASLQTSCSADAADPVTARASEGEDCGEEIEDVEGWRLRGKRTIITVSEIFEAA